MKRLLPILTLLFIFMLTPFASATTPLGLTQSEVDILSGYGREGMGDKTKFAIDYRQYAGGSLDEYRKPTAHFQLKLQNSVGDILEIVESPREKGLELPIPKLKYSIYSRDVGNKITIENLSSPYTGRTINMYDIQHRFVPEGKNRADYPIHSYDPTKVTSWSRVQQIIDDAINSVNENGTLEIYLAVSDKGEPYNNLPNWSANGNVAVLDTTKPNLYPKGMIWYFTGMEIEFGDEWWVDVITTEPDEIPEDWEIDTHLGTGKVVTNQGMANLDAAANNLTYFKNGDKVTIDYTFWNPMDDMSIAPPLKYVVMYWKHPDSWLNMPSNYEKNYIYTDYTTQDIFPRDNVGSLSYEYTVDIDSYPYELTTGRQINELTQDYPPELKAKVNPCKDDDLFMSLAVVVDPDAVLSPQSETLEPGQQTWVSLNTNIMVVHIPVEKGLDIGVELTPRQPYWQIPSDLGYVHPIIDINFSVNIDDHEWLIIADGYKEVVGITKESLQMVKTSGKLPLQDSISFKVTEPGKYTIRAGIPTEDENGTPILFDIDGELQPDINPANNHDEIVIEVSIGPPSQIKTDPDIDTGYEGGDHMRSDLTG